MMPEELDAHMQRKEKRKRLLSFTLKWAIILNKCPNIKFIKLMIELWPNYFMMTIKPCCLNFDCFLICERIQDMLCQCLGCSVLENKVLTLVHSQSQKENRCLVDGEIVVKTYTLFCP